MILPLGVHFSKRTACYNTLEGIQQLRGHNFAIGEPNAWTVFIFWAWTKTDIFWPLPPSSYPRSYWMTPYDSAPRPQRSCFANPKEGRKKERTFFTTKVNAGNLLVTLSKSGKKCCSVHCYCNSRCKRGLSKV